MAMKMNCAMDSERLRQIIWLLSREFGQSQKEVLKDFNNLSCLPIQKQLDLVSEAWMTYA